MESLGRDERTPASSLIDRLLDDPHGFNLFQAIGLLERHTALAQARGGRLAVGDGEDEAVRLSGHVALGFQPSDIHRVTAHGRSSGAGAAQHRGPAYVLATQAMTLAGGQGPLPQPYTELVLERLAARDAAMRDFLDIFNHRFLGFLFRSRKKHAPGLNWESPLASPLASCVRAIAHLDPASGEGDDAPWLRHAGLMTAAPRSMTGLLSLLADRFGLAVHGTQFVGDWLALDAGDRMRLGAGAMLNAGRALGRRVWDQAAAIDITFHDVGVARFREFLPTGRLHGSLSCLMKRYLPCRIDVRLTLRLPPGVHLAARLGGSTAAQLGWTSWLRQRQDGGGQPVRAARTHATRESRNVSSVRIRL